VGHPSPIVSKDFWRNGRRAARTVATPPAGRLVVETPTVSHFSDREIDWFERRNYTFECWHWSRVPHAHHHGSRGRAGLAATHSSGFAGRH
jgi:hypothetical protein